MGTAAVTKAEFIRRSSAVPELFMNKVDKTTAKARCLKVFRAIPGRTLALGHAWLRLLKWIRRENS